MIFSDFLLQKIFYNDEGKIEKNNIYGMILFQFSFSLHIYLYNTIIQQSSAVYCFGIKDKISTFFKYGTQQYFYSNRISKCYKSLLLNF